MKSNYLKYWRVVRRYIYLRYGIDQDHLELLLFLHDEEFFTRRKVEEFERLMRWRKRRLDAMVEEGWIVMFRKGEGKKKAALFQISGKAKRMINSLYTMLDADDLSVMSRWHVKCKSEADKRHREFMQNIITETQRLQRLALESRSENDHQ